MIQDMKPQLARKIVTVEQLARLAQQYHDEGVQVVHCHGCFDVVHPGHVRYLQSAGSHGDVLVVSLTGDDAIEKADGTRPYIPQEYRAENLAALEFVDHVVIADGPTA
jgi:cytidyltransferase-like protein